MARSARELFEEAMRLDPAERAALMRLLIDTLDAESEEAPSKRFPGKSLERDCINAE